MRGNGASYDDPGDPYDDQAGDDYDLLDDLADEDARQANARRRAQQRSYRPRYTKPTRRPAAERDSSFNALLWLLDGATGLVEEMRHNDLGLPEEFWMHADAARKESLMALRTILDEWIDEEPPPPQDAPPKRRGGIDIDF
jgi:hypothetical protein